MLSQTSYVKVKKAKLVMIIIIGFTSLALLSIISLSLGALRMSISKVVMMLIGLDSSDITLRSIIFDIRLPRLASAIIVGASLSASGAVMQTLFRNPLIDPYIGGISSGAAFGISASMLLGLSLLSPASPYAIPSSAFLGSIAALSLTLLLSKVTSGSPLNFVLSGLATSFLFSSATTITLILGGEKAYGVLFWLFGSFSASSWRFLHVMFPIFLLTVSFTLLKARKLNVLLLGDDEASQLGVNVILLRYLLLMALSALSASAVAFNGIIGFVGLIGPHLSRLLVGNDHRMLLPLSMMIGSLILTASDIAARMAIAPAELPVGAITSLIGVPIFLHLLIRRGRHYE